MEWSKQQEQIFEWFERGSGNLIVQARAGCAKTTSIIEGVNHAPEQRILLAAFSKLIATELSERIKNPACEAKTLHSVGYAAIRRYWERVRISSRGERADGLARTVAGEQAPDSMVRLLSKLHSKAREIVPLATTADAIRPVALEFECSPDDEWAEDGYDLDWITSRALRCMELAAAHKPTATGIDFADMIFLPLRNDWLRPRYDLVIIDECLPYKTPVLMADGSSVPIGKLVDSRSTARVLAYNTKTGRQVRKRITGWQKVPNRKPLVKVSTRRQDDRSGSNRNFIVCTEDHQVWTRDRGWISAEKLKAGDVVQVETSADKSQAYKITSKGRRTLGELRANDGHTREKGRQGYISRRGGNGTGPTKYEQALMDELGDGYVFQFVVTTGEPKVRGGYPPNYKIDIANPDCKIAVEVDGKSHRMNERKEQDRKKDDWLRRHGWKVFRFANRDAWQRPQECAAEVLSHEQCPVDAVVHSVDPVDIRDDYVYDITVEDAHCFYANGILVHNCQDMSAAQIMIARRIARGRIVVVGDERQAIFAFRGADSSSMQRLRRELEATELTLKTTYRCARAIVREAQRLVPDFEAGASNPEGVVRSMPRHGLAASVDLGDFVLSRKNAPLAGVALEILRRGVRCRIEGKDIGKGLIALIRRIATGKARNSMPEFLGKLTAWEDREVLRAERSNDKGAEARIERIQDQAETLRALAEGLSGVRELQARIEGLFADKDRDKPSTRVTCSSIHRAKGLEADRVFVLRDTLNPSIPCTCGHWPGAHEDDGGPCGMCGCDGLRENESRVQEEANLEYVCITRARRELVYVEGK